MPTNRHAIGAASGLGRGTSIFERPSIKKSGGRYEGRLTRSVFPLAPGRDGGRRTALPSPQGRAGRTSSGATIPARRWTSGHALLHSTGRLGPAALPWMPRATWHPGLRRHRDGADHERVDGAVVGNLARLAEGDDKLVALVLQAGIKGGAVIGRDRMRYVRVLPVPLDRLAHLDRHVVRREPANRVGV